MRKLKTWWTDLRWLKRGDWAFLCLPVSMMVLMTIAFVGLVLVGQWIAFFPALGFVGILIQTLSYIQSTVKSNKWWANWEAKWQLDIAELRRIRKEIEG